jgi:hypothetical protein
VKQRVYFFRCGITKEISFISRRTGSLPLAGIVPAPFVAACLFAPGEAVLFGISSSRRRFLEEGSEDVGVKLQI